MRPDGFYRFLETAACPRSCGVLAPLTNRRAKPAASAVSAASAALNSKRRAMLS